MARRVLANLDLQANEVINLGTPTLSTDGANKAYVDGVAAAASIPLAIRKSVTQQTQATATLTNVTGLSWTVASGVMYHFKIMGSYQSNNTANGIGFAFTGPATTYCSWNVQIQQAAAGTDMMYQNVATALTTALNSASVVATATTYAWELEGFFQPSAAGTLQLQFRSEVNGNTSTLNAGTLGILTTIG